MARERNRNDAPSGDEQPEVQHTLSADAAAPELVDVKQGEKYRVRGNELPTEVPEQWAGRYKLLHGRICLRTRGKVSEQNPEGELLSNWYERGVVLKLSAIDAHRFYHLGVVARVDEEGREEPLPKEIADPELQNKALDMRKLFAARDRDAQGLNSAPIG